MVGKDGGRGPRARLDALVRELGGTVVVAGERTVAFRAEEDGESCVFRLTELEGGLILRQLSGSGGGRCVELPFGGSAAAELDGRASSPAPREGPSRTGPLKWILGRDL